jgi:hypothetical protein
MLLKEKFCENVLLHVIIYLSEEVNAYSVNSYCITVGYWRDYMWKLQLVMGIIYFEFSPIFRILNI